MKAAHREGRALLAVAAPAEARAVCAPFGAVAPDAGPRWSLTRLDDGLDLLLTGVGKANAAGATAWALAGGRYSAVLNLGVAGALPGPAPPGLGRVVLADRCAFADEGVALAEPEFADIAALGFPPMPGLQASAFQADSALSRVLAPLAHLSGIVATVSTCSGTDAAASAIAARTGAIAEAMEGAACALVCARLGVPFGEMRVISNTTGARDSQRWDLPGALRVLADLATRL